MSAPRSALCPDPALARAARAETAIRAQAWADKVARETGDTAEIVTGQAAADLHRWHGLLQLLALSGACRAVIEPVRLSGRLARAMERLDPAPLPETAEEWHSLLRSVRATAVRADKLAQSTPPARARAADLWRLYRWLTLRCPSWARTPQEKTKEAA